MIEIAAARAVPLAGWRAVPERVTKLLPAALALRAAHDKAAAATGLLQLAAVSWEPESAQVFVHTVAPQSEYTKTAYVKKLGGPATFTTDDIDPNAVIIKLADTWFPQIGAAWRNANHMLGVPAP